MNQNDNNVRTNLKKRTNALIVHGKVVLVILALFAAISTLETLSWSTNTFLPIYYIIFTALAQSLLIIPGIFCFKYPKVAFITGAIFSGILIIRTVIFGNNFSSLLFAYVLIASILAYQAF